MAVTSPTVDSSLSQSRLMELLDYDPVSGVFRWRRKRSGVKGGPGTIAGSFDKDGYRMICVDRQLYRSGRLAWFYVYGEWPKNQIDHINRDKTDDSIANLRDVEQSPNCRNVGIVSRNTSGVRGVTWVATRNKWRASTRRNGKIVHLGYFTSIDDADQAYRAAQ